MIEISCPKCWFDISRHDNEAGSTIPCPSCGQRVQLPGPSADDDLTAKILLAADKGMPSGNSPDAAGAIRFSCPHCRATIKAGMQKAGARVKCPQCKLPLEVPSPKGKLREESGSTSAVMPLTTVLVAGTPSAEDWGSLVQPVSVPTSRGGDVPKKRTPIALWLGICCGSLVLVCCGGLGFIMLVDSLGRSESRPFPVELFTEAAAREQLKKALDIWVTGGTPQTLAQTHTDIDFADPLFSDAADLLGYDIERAEFYGGRERILYVSMKYRVDGLEKRYSRFYEVAKPDERGIWRISVSSYTPPAPAVSRAPPVADAHDRLKTALDAWVARTWKADFAKQHPAIDFVDLDYSDTNIIVRYDIGDAFGPSPNGTWKFHVFLVFLSTQQTEFRILKSYEVDRPNDRGIWHIRGYRP